MLFKDIVDIILHYIAEPSGVSSVWNTDYPRNTITFWKWGREILPRCKTEGISLIPPAGVTFLGCTLLLAV
jgi:hypothetical protein